MVFSGSTVRNGATLRGWGESPITPPGSGPQSWLFCPLIFVALESVEVACGVAPWSTGSRHPVPAIEIIQMFGTFVQSLSPESEAAQGLQHNWDGREHLPARLQELCSPPHIMSALCVWIQGVMGSFLPLPLPATSLFRECPVRSHPVPRPSRSAPNPFSAATPLLDPSDPVNPFSVITPTPGLLEPVNPFSAAAPTVPKCLVRRLLFPIRSWLCLLNPPVSQWWSLFCSPIVPPMSRWWWTFPRCRTCTSHTVS